jgi:hypothetical protein
MLVFYLGGVPLGTYAPPILAPPPILDLVRMTTGEVELLAMSGLGALALLAMSTLNPVLLIAMSGAAVDFSAASSADLGLIG